MNPYQRKVRAFMQAIRQKTPNRPTIEGYDIGLRSGLILEEAQEFADALYAVDGEIDWPEAIKELCDILYVTFGAAVAMGVDLEPFFDLVHASNMAKLNGPIRADGKKLKPPGWKAPNLAGLLKRMNGVADE